MQGIVLCATGCRTIARSLTSGRELLRYEPREKHHLRRERQRVGPGKDRFHARGKQRPQVSADAEVSVREVGQNCGNVRQEPEPSDATSGASRFNRKPCFIGIQEPGEVNAARGAESVEAPGAGVHVEEFVPAVSRIALIFDLD